MGGVQRPPLQGAAGSAAVPLTGHTTLDASIGYRFTLGDLTLRGRNLTDQLYTDAASPAISRVVLGPPRTVDLTFTVRY